MTRYRHNLKRTSNLSSFALVGSPTDSTQHSPEASLCGVSLTPTLQGLCLAGVGTSAQGALGGLQSHSESALLFQGSGVEAEPCIGKPCRLGEPESGGGDQASFLSFSKDIIIYLVLVCVWVCHRTCVEITGQFTRVLSLFSPYGS